jgi:hypothetical protein
MKLLKFVFLFSIFLARPADALIITEVQIAGDEANHDYVKIYNPGKELDISGFQLKKKTSSGREYSIRVFPKTTTALEQDYLIWANSSDDFAEKMNADLRSTATLAQNNSIALFDNDKNIVSALAWGEGSNPFREGDVSLANPTANQQIKRKQSDQGIYLDEKNNSKDFYLTSTFQEKDVYVPRAKNLRHQSRSLVGTIIAAMVIGLLASKSVQVYYKNNLNK